MHHALAALQIFHPQPAQLLAANAVIEQGSENGAIALTLERVFGRSVEQFAGLNITERRSAAFVSIGHRTLDAINGIAEHGVAFT